MITVQDGVTLMVIISKLGIKLDEIDAKADAEEVGKQLIQKMLENFPRIQDDIFALIAGMKNVTAEQAKQLPLIPILQEITGDEVLKGFFKSALR